MTVKKYIAPAVVGLATGFFVGKKIGEAYLGILDVSDSDYENIVHAFEGFGALAGMGVSEYLAGKVRNRNTEPPETRKYRY